MSKLMLMAVAVGLAAIGAGCGEKTAVMVYKQGQYQGKPDQRPWDNSQFKDDKTNWELAIKRRNSYQNEYTRIAVK